MNKPLSEKNFSLAMPLGGPGMSTLAPLDPNQLPLVTAEFEIEMTSLNLRNPGCKYRFAVPPAANYQPHPGFILDGSRTRFDIDLDLMPQVAEGQYLLVTLKLADSAAWFADGNLAVMAGDAAGSTVLFAPVGGNPKVSARTAQFYCKKTNNYLQHVPYSFCIIVDDEDGNARWGQQVIYDPKIKNDG